MTIKPAKNQLFCKQDVETEEKTRTGFYIPKQAQETPQTAEVINIGSGVTGFSQKDKIVYKPYASTIVKLNGEEYFIIAEEDVLGTVV